MHSKYPLAEIGIKGQEQSVNSIARKPVALRIRKNFPETWFWNHYTIG